MIHVLEAIALSKRYGRNSTLFKDVSFSLEPGTVTVLVGSNGTGKSTLMRIVAGLTIPSSGEVVGRGPTIGIVPERFVPPGNLSASVYTTNMGRLRGASTKNSALGSTGLLARLGLGQGANVPLKLLSKGDAQKVAIAQAFMLRVDLLVLDEPRTGLDLIANTVLDELIGEATKTGTTVLISGHELQMGQADQILEIAGGSLSRAAVRAASPRIGNVMVHIVRTDHSSLLSDFLGHLGHLDVTIAPGRIANEVLLLIHSHQVDAVLQLALTNHWSVLKVQPAGDTGSTGGTLC